MAGLGVRYLKDFNISLLAKWWWKLRQDGDSLWSRVIKSIHRMKEFDDSKLFKKFYNGTWKGVTKIESDFLEAGISLRDLFRRIIGRGNKTRFWKDLWAAGIPLKDKFTRLYRIEAEKNSLIMDRVKWHNFNDIILDWLWNKPNLSAREGIKVQELVRLLKSFEFSEKDDGWEWILENDKIFSVKSLRNALDLSKKDVVPSLIKWNSWVPEKVNCFSWRLTQNKIPLKVNLSSKGIQLANLCCSFCGTDLEEVEHVFASCEFSKKIWQEIGLWCGFRMGDITSLKDVIECVLSLCKSSKQKKFGTALIQAVCWAIWKTRNEANFRKKK